MKTLVGFLSLLALTLTISCNTNPTPATSYGAAGGTSIPIIPTSWTVATWFIDPIAGDDNAAGTTSGAPLKTWHRLHDQIWGCTNGIARGCPRFQQNTTITWLTRAPDCTDPVYFAPANEAGIYSVLKGTLPTGTSGTLSNVTAGGGATRVALELAQSPGTPVAGAFLVNTTHAGAAWAVALSSGAIWKWSQPTTRAAVPTTTVATALPEVTTWANGDSATMYLPSTLPGACLMDIEPISPDSAGTSNGGVTYIQNLSNIGVANSSSVMNANVIPVESNFSRATVFERQGHGGGFGIGYILNDYASASIGVAGSEFNSTVVGNGYYAAGLFGSGVLLDGDVGVTGGVTISSLSAQQSVSDIESVYLDTGSVLSLTYASITFGALGTGISWGPGSINILGSGRIVPANSAVSSFLQAGGLKIGGQSKVCLNLLNAATTTLTCNITLTPAAVDSNLTSAGCLYAGNGAFCNYGQ